MNNHRNSPREPYKGNADFSHPAFSTHDQRVVVNHRPMHHSNYYASDPNRGLKLHAATDDTFCTDHFYEANYREPVTRNVPIPQLFHRNSTPVRLCEQTQAFSSGGSRRKFPTASSVSEKVQNGECMIPDGFLYSPVRATLHNQPGTMNRMNRVHDARMEVCPTAYPVFKVKCYALLKNSGSLFVCTPCLLEVKETSVAITTYGKLKDHILHLDCNQKLHPDLAKYLVKTTPEDFSYVSSLKVKIHTFIDHLIGSGLRDSTPSIIVLDRSKRTGNCVIKLQENLLLDFGSRSGSEQLSENVLLEIDKSKERYRDFHRDREQRILKWCLGVTASFLGA